MDNAPNLCPTSRYPKSGTEPYNDLKRTSASLRGGCGVGHLRGWPANGHPWARPGRCPSARSGPGRFQGLRQRSFLELAGKRAISIIIITAVLLSSMITHTHLYIYIYLWITCIVVGTMIQIRSVASSVRLAAGLKFSNFLGGEVCR